MLDTIYYILGYAPDHAFELFIEEYDKAFDEYELAYCKSLLGLMQKAEWSPSREKFLDIIEGELLLKQHNPFDAADRFEKLCSAEIIITDSELMSRAFEGLGKCMILGCEIGGKNMSEALENLEKAFELTKQSGDKSRSASILTNIGLTMEALGRHEEAFRHYDQAISDAIAVPDYKLAADITDNFTELLRQSGKMDVAREWALKGLEWRKYLENAHELVKSYHKLAPIFGFGARNDKDLQESLAYYQKAIDLYTEMNDPFGLADIYRSMGWVYHEMFKNAEQAGTCAEKSLSICNRYGIGKTKGDTLALLFDMADDAGNGESAMPILEEALDISRRHAGIYTIQHMLSHKIAICKQLGQYSQIPSLVEEMKSYIEKGIRIHVFYGRSLVLWGDCAFDDKDYNLAFERYHTGYHYLTDAGHNAAWEAWGAYKRLVEDHLPGKLRDLDPAERQKQCDAFIHFWTEAGLAVAYPELIEVCKSNLAV